MKGEKETGQDWTTDEKPPGLEDVESEQQAKQEEQGRAQEALEEHRRAHEARELQVRPCDRY